jgi:hypothetical protein
MNSSFFRTGFAALGMLSLLARGAVDPVALSWLGSQPAAATGVSFGVPWPQGALAPHTALHLHGANQELPIQTWPLAYWPDGSVKWTGVAAVVPTGWKDTLALDAERDHPQTRLPASSSGAAAVSTQESPTAITVDTGALQCVFPRQGETLISSLSVNGRPIATAGKLICLLQTGPSDELSGDSAREPFLGSVRTVTVEQSGPVRAVVRCEGLHHGGRAGRDWLPFTVRFYFYAGQTSVRVVHTIIFDGDQQKDFIRGLGIEFAVPLRDPVRSRYVRFGGEGGGLWSEPLQPGGGSAEQEAGEPFELQGNFTDNAVWSDFKLVQPNPHGFTVVKRTNPHSTWLASAAGGRSSGYVFLGDREGGLGVSIRHFWQSYPASLEVHAAEAAAGRITAWLWSPDGPAMDMRHYDIVAHTLSASYEDVQPGLSTAYGVARTSELTLLPSAELPSKARSAAEAVQAEELPLLVSSPRYLHSTRVFGVWSLPDRSTPFKRAIEDGLDSVLGFYERQVDQRDWYGFWQYGDVIHSYSLPRHVWHYDWGGHAWDNTELGAPLWLWYSFLRTGRADLFRFAEAYTRNTSETDVYHLGPMAGLGSRHNVIKWGDGAKEARISQAAHWRVFYYLTTDERTGDIMRETVHADLAIARFDPMREAEPPVPGEPVYPARVRIGPDWFALAGNWMTEWERTGQNQWRDRILAGVDSLLAMPYWLRSGQMNGLNPDLPNNQIGPLKGGGSMTVAYDAATGKLTAIRDPLAKAPVPVNYNLSTIQGGAEVMFELVPLLGRQDFATAWLQYCRLGTAPAEVLDRDRTTGNEGADASFVQSAQSGPRLGAYSYAHTHNPAYAARAIKGLLSQHGGTASPRWVSGPDAIRPVEEAPGLSTNEAAQTGLQTIELLELCQDHLPTAAPAFTPRERDGPPNLRRVRNAAPAGTRGTAAPASGSR